MNVATFGISINPTAAQQGAQAVNTALASIGTQAAATSAKVHSAATSFGAGLTTAAAAATTTATANAAKSATAAEATLSKMGQTTRGFFGNAGQAVQSMTGHITTFAASVLQFIPGPTGMIVGLGQASLGAATGISGLTAASGALALALVPLIAALVAATALMAFLATTIFFGDKMTASIGKIKAATGDLKIAGQVYESLYQTALKTGTGINESAGAFVRFSIAARSIGASNSQIVQLVDTIQKAGLVSGASTAEMTAGMLQLGQALSSGRLQGDELRSVLESMPLLAEKLAKELGTDIAGLRAMGEAGKLTSDIVFPAILRTSAQINKEFEGLPTTIGRGFSTLSIAFARLMADIDKGLGGSKAVANFFADATLQLENFRRTLVGLMSKDNQEGGINVIAEYLGLKLKVAFLDAVNAAVKAFSDGIEALGNTLKKSLSSPSTVVTTARLMIPGLSTATDALGPDITNAAAAAIMGVNPDGSAAGDPFGLLSAKDRIKQIEDQASLFGKPDELPTITITKKALPPPYQGTDGTDAYSMWEMQQKLNDLEAAKQYGGMSDKEFGRRTNDIKDQTAGQLMDPTKQNELYQNALGDWRVFQAEKAKVAAETDKAISDGSATMFDSFERGVTKAVDSWGNAQQQIAKLGEGVANTLSSSLTTAITEFANGTKTAGEAFGDMAKSIIEEITRMVIQMIVQLVIQQAINAAMGRPMAAVSIPTTAGHYAIGGEVQGGRGGIDDIPAMLTAGEYVMSRRAVETYGAEFMGRINNGTVGRYASGGPVQNGSGQMGNRGLGTVRGAKKGESTALNIINVVDPNMINEHLANNPECVVNAISRRAPQVKAIIQR